MVSDVGPHKADEAGGGKMKEQGGITIKEIESLDNSLRLLAMGLRKDADELEKAAEIIYRIRLNDNRAEQAAKAKLAARTWLEAYCND